ncbi:hypothetical protein F3J44_11240 [Pantoea sp. Tr-811]|uniref:hypothetical protein n=1 Tax=Pantoea sp. Tr-811 TaxID=2608361 RepID=UPI0014241485|nr:hypothetical protein [Pantoea sp. Tr-811]NIF26948.1 hypothetical protein [Pantoea sp. Tr-811]
MGNQDGSWPIVATVARDGSFGNDHLSNRHLADGKTTLTVRMDYQDRKFTERYSATVSQMLELHGQLVGEERLVVSGKASPPGATVEALNSAGNWVGIQSVGADGGFINENLTTAYLRDGKETLEVRLRLADSRVTQSMTVIVAKP